MTYRNTEARRAGEIQKGTSLILRRVKRQAGKNDEAAN